MPSSLTQARLSEKHRLLASLDQVLKGPGNQGPDSTAGPSGSRGKPPASILIRANYIHLMD